MTEGQLLDVRRSAEQIAALSPEEQACRPFRIRVAELLEILNRTLETIPGEWVCPKCSYFESRVILNPATGMSGPNPSPALPCPNDGEFMVPLTWKQHALDLRKMIDGLLERVLSPREIDVFRYLIAERGVLLPGLRDEEKKEIWAKLERIAEAKP